MFSPKKFPEVFTIVLFLTAILLSSCSEKSEYGDASDYEKFGASCVNSTGDTTAPTFSLTPSDNSTNVPRATKILVTFSDEMRVSSITVNTDNTNCSGSFQLSSDDFSSCVQMSASPVASDNGTTFTITPASSLSLSTNYKIKLTTEVEEISCNNMATDNTTINGFTTAATGSGTIKGQVISDVNNSALPGVNVQFYGTTIDNTTTDSDGDFSSGVDVGDYTIAYSLDGYIDETQNVPLETDGQTLEVQTLRMLSSSCSSTGSISGTVTDAVSGDNLTGVYLEARRGFNRPLTTVIATDTTDSSGVYSFSSMSRGWYTVYTSKSGYIDGSFYARSCGDISNQNAAISEVLPGTKSMRIVLSWPKTTPVTGRDLDSHLQFDNSTNPFHLHWEVSGKNYVYGVGDNVTLDRDETEPPGVMQSNDTVSSGIETITIIETRSGPYSYSVHDYTNRDNTSANFLANSGANVTVYYNNTTTQYTVPSGTGNLWRVFTFSESDGFTTVGTLATEATHTDVY